MFSNGKFKNIVAETEINEIIAPSQSLQGTYALLPLRGVTKNWIAVEGSLFSSSHHDASLEALNSKLAPSTPPNATYFSSKVSNILEKNSFCEHPRKLPFTKTRVDGGEEEEASVLECIGNYTEKNVFAINVSYYVKIKLSFSSIGSDISLKLPFILGNLGQEKKEYSNYENSKKKVEDSKENLALINEPPNFSKGCTHEAVLNETPNEYEHSSASDLELSSALCTVEAQIHERKYLESDM